MSIGVLAACENESVREVLSFERGAGQEQRRNCLCSNHMFHPHRSFSGVLSSPSSTDMSEGEPDAKATEVASPSKQEVDDVAANADATEAGEDTPLVGKKIEVVVKDEHEKADVTTTAVTDEGAWC